MNLPLLCRSLTIPLGFLTAALPFSTLRAGTPTDLFTGTGKPPVHTYRIPSLCVTTKGTLLAFAELRRNGGGDSGNIDTVLRRSTDHGKTWSPDIPVLDLDDHTIGNACPIVDPKTGRITVIAVWNRVHESKTAPGFGNDSRLVFTTSSDDDGLTWSKPQDISKQVKQPDWGWMATGPGAGIVKKLPPHAGRYLVGVNHNLPADGRAYFAHAIFSDDSGKTWASSKSFAARGTNECEIVELADGSLMLNMRNQGTGKRDRAVSISKDGGETWQETTYDPQLPEPVCQGSILRHSWPADGKPGPILFSNPASTTARENLTLRASYDEGKTWSRSLLVKPGDAAYSHLAVLPDGTIALAYETDGYRKIAFTTIRVDELNPPGR